VALSRDAIFSLIVGCVVFGLAVGVGAAHLGAQADPTTPANPRPDWYLIWYFALLALIPPASENYFIILFPLLAFLILFLIPLANKGERHPLKRPWSIAIVVVAALSTLVLIVLGYEASWAPVFTANNGIPSVPAQATRGLDPVQLKGAHYMQLEGCMACHRIGSVGGKRGPNLTQVGNRLTDEQLIFRIAHGGGGMPAYGQTMKPSTLSALVAFLSNPKYERTQQPLQQAAP
jgi:ubiquinol-cytochrome c reductase cytochrome b subunit